MKTTRQIVPATGWCYAFQGRDGQTHVWDVALCALLDDGDVVGLISAEIAKTKSNLACLTSPPPVGGIYFLKGSDDDPRVKPWPVPDFVPPDPSPAGQPDIWHKMIEVGRQLEAERHWRTKPEGKTPPDSP